MTPTPRHLAAVLFDMDGVLVDSTASHVVAWSRFLDERGIDHPELGIPSLFGRRAVEAVAALLHVEPGSEAALSAVTELEGYADELLRATEPGGLVTPGAADLVRRLADDGWRLAVATSARREVATHSLGALLPTFDAVVAAEDVVRGKPDPEVYLTAAARLGVPPHVATVVEDAPAGVEAGTRALMHVIGVSSTATRQQLLAAGAAVVVDHLAEVLPIVVERRQRRLAELGRTGGLAVVNDPVGAREDPDP